MILWWGLNMVLIFFLMCLLRRISGDTGVSLFSRQFAQFPFTLRKVHRASGTLAFRMQRGEDQAMISPLPGSCV